RAQPIPSATTSTNAASKHSTPTAPSTLRPVRPRSHCPACPHGIRHTSKPRLSATKGNVPQDVGAEGAWAAAWAGGAVFSTRPSEGTTTGGGVRASAAPGLKMGAEGNGAGGGDGGKGRTGVVAGARACCQVSASGPQVLGEGCQLERNGTHSSGETAGSCPFSIS